MASDEERGTEPRGGESEGTEPQESPVVQPPGGGEPVVGTAIGESDAGAGVQGGDVGRAGSPGAGAGGTGGSRATVPGAAEPGKGEADDTLDLDVGEFARATAERGDEAGLGGGQGDLGAGGDLAGDYGGLDEEGDEGTPV